MSDERYRDPTPAERRAQDAVRELPAARASEAFRAKLREEFVSGRIAPRLRLVQPAWWTRPIGWGSIAAAAAAALVVGAFALNRAPDWRLIGVEGTGVALVDGRRIPLDHTAELARALRRGARVVTPDSGMVDLVIPGVLAVNLDMATDVTLPAGPGRWWARHARARVANGYAFYATGRAFHGATLDVQTPEVNAHVTGTSLAVLRDDEQGTCVCVMEGRVHVQRWRGGVPGGMDVPAGQRCISLPNGAQYLKPILEYSTHALHRLHARAGALLGR